MLLCSAVQAQTMGVFPYRWNDAPPADAITPADIREALVWTGHLDFFFKGELSGAVRKGTQAWQKAKGHQPTDRLSDEQTAQLIKDALKERDAVGWSMLRDPAVGFAIGVPTKLASFGTPHIDGSTLYYYAAGTITQSIAFHPGYPTCRTLGALLSFCDRRCGVAHPRGQLVRRRVQPRRRQELPEGEVSSSRVDRHGDDRYRRDSWRSTLACSSPWPAAWC